MKNEKKQIYEKTNYYTELQLYRFNKNITSNQVTEIINLNQDSLSFFNLLNNKIITEKEILMK